MELKKRGELHRRMEMDYHDLSSWVAQPSEDTKMEMDYRDPGSWVAQPFGDIKCQIKERE